MAFDDNKRELSIDELENANTDRSVNPAVMVRGMAAKNGSNWVFVSADSSGNLVTNSTVTATFAPLSADSSSISAIQGDAGKLRVSALGTFATTPQNNATETTIISAIGNADLLTVSSGQNMLGLQLSGTWSGQVNFQASVDGTNFVATDFVNAATDQLVNATAANGTFVTALGGYSMIRISATSWTSGTLSATTQLSYGHHSVHLESPLPEGTFHLGSVSSIVDNGSVSAKSGDANQVHVSAVQGDAGLLNVSSHADSADQFHVSAFSNAAAQLRVSAFQLDAGNTHVSAFVDSGSISAKNQDANFMHVSGFSPDAGLFRVSSTVDSGSVSAKSSDANQVHVSAIQGDSGLLHVSAGLFPDTVGGLTVFQTLSVSASQSVKGSAGALYGYYFYNSDTKPNYIKLYNVSAAANLGTDTPLMTIMLPASAAANVEYPHGLAGFTNGINITATSGRPLDNTALPAASSVGAVLFYK